MSDRWIRGIVLGLLLIIIGVPLIFQRTESGQAELSDGKARQSLVLISPHNESIRHELSVAFNKWRVAQNKSPVHFDWRSSGGTGDLRKQVLAEFDRAAANNKEDQGIGYDVFFGGGDVEHNRLAQGITIERDGKKVQIPALVPVEFPPGMLQEIYPEPTIAGEPLYHKDKLWVGVVLSSFGIVFNRDLLRDRNLPEPLTWTDLIDGRYFNELALGDPAHSSSVAAAYHAPLRRLGWTDGWALLRRVLANGRYITASGSKPAVDVSAGEAAAGMSIDFFGRFQAGAVGGNRLGYVEPKHMTTINADPIAILRGAPNKALANEFILWLLSPEAQGLWQRKLGTPNGPELFELRRMPVRRDVYTPAELANWTDPINPFDAARAFPSGTPVYFSPIAAVSHAMAIDIHEDLRAAWRAILDHPSHPRREEMLKLFDAMPEELTLTWPDAELAENWQKILESSDHARRKEVVAHLNTFLKTLSDRYGGWKGESIVPARLAWTKFFRENYRQIVRIANESP